MILIIDNYDSFVHNLARYVRELGFEVEVIRNDQYKAKECVEFNPDGVIISPGPKRPKEAGVSLELIEMLPLTTPLLGVCLGHQCLIESFGGETLRSQFPLHGQASEVIHNGRGIFLNVPSPMMAGRYHSLISTLGDRSPLAITALSDNKEIMAVQHKTQPWFGVQFHPESLLTPHGRVMVMNFVSLCKRSRSTDE